MAVKLTLTFTNGTLRGQRREFTGPAECLIGRSDDCDLQLPPGREFMDVSRHHCLLEIDPAAVRVRDLGSRNGTFVNGQNIGQRPWGEGREKASESGWHPLLEGDELNVGETRLRVEICAAQECDCVR